MASQVTIINRARAVRVCEVGRVAPYGTAKVSESWYLRNQHGPFMSAAAYREGVRKMGATKVRAEATRAGVDRAGDLPAVRERIFEHIGLPYEKADLGDPSDEPRAVEDLDFTEVDGIGEDTAQDIRAALRAKGVETAEGVLALELVTLPDIGEAKAEKLRDWLESL